MFSDISENQTINQIIVSDLQEKNQNPSFFRFFFSNLRGTNAFLLCHIWCIDDWLSALSLYNIWSIYRTKCQALVWMFLEAFPDFSSSCLLLWPRDASPHHQVEDRPDLNLSSPHYNVKSKPPDSVITSTHIFWISCIFFVLHSVIVCRSCIKIYSSSISIKVILYILVTFHCQFFIFIPILLDLQYLHSISLLCSLLCIKTLEHIPRMCKPAVQNTWFTFCVMFVFISTGSCIHNEQDVFLPSLAGRGMIDKAIYVS